MSFITIYITHPTEVSAKEISNTLISEKLVACANLLPIQASYWWKGEINNDQEWVSLVKTTEEKWEAVKSRVEELHAYDTPCIMKTVVEANEEYEAWIVGSVSDEQ